MGIANGYARPELLAEPGWLWEHRDDPNLRVVDCGSPEAYDRAHIPGAARLGQGDFDPGRSRPVPWDPWLKDRDDPVHVMKPEPFADLMGRLGVSDEITVVAYDDFNGTFATRLWWALTYYGHPDVKVLNGGWQRWLDDGRPVTFREFVPIRGRFTARPREAMRVRVDELLTRHCDPDVQVVNVLPPEMYRGRSNPFGNKRAGHVPGATNLPIERFFVAEDVPTLKPAPELATVVNDHGLSPARETIIHCQAGVRTTMGVFALSLLGWDGVRAHEASLAEWANRDDIPLVTGEDVAG
jgi:thiosulfate/3-mercaptopyruvate sulfurtransferase